MSDAPQEIRLDPNYDGVRLWAQLVVAEEIDNFCRRDRVAWSEEKRLTALRAILAPLSVALQSVINQDALESLRAAVFAAVEKIAAVENTVKRENEPPDIEREETADGGTE
jgi:hypothetical protein